MFPCWNVMVGWHLITGSMRSMHLDDLFKAQEMTSEVAKYSLNTWHKGKQLFCRTFFFLQITNKRCFPFTGKKGHDSKYTSLINNENKFNNNYCLYFFILFIMFVFRCHNNMICACLLLLIAVRFS